jgi:hypothetical protein
MEDLTSFEGEGVGSSDDGTSKETKMKYRRNTTQGESLYVHVNIQI